MLKKRIIPCLDIKAGRVVKGVQFESLQDAGDPVELANFYALNGADELVFLDITASQERRKTMLPLVERIAEKLNIPFTVGGGVSTLEDAALLLEAGADKISINTSAVRSPELINQIAARFGSQCVVVAIDTVLINGSWEVTIEGGRTYTGMRALEWAKQVAERGAGEILLTSMNNDGCKDGFSLGITGDICSCVTVPVIASGGAGNCSHFYHLFSKTNAAAGLAASIFHFGELSIPDLKEYLKNQKIAIR